MSGSSPTKPSITITARSAPFMGEPEQASQFYEALGRAIFLWGRFESTFATALLLIPAIGGDDFIEHSLPNDWSRRLKLWRHGFSKIEVLAPLCDHAIKFADSVAIQVHNRHALMHGSWTQFTQPDPIKARLNVKRLEGKSGFSQKSYDLGIAELNAFALEADRLNTRLLPFMFNMMQHQRGFPPTFGNAEETP